MNFRVLGIEYHGGGLYKVVVSLADGSVLSVPLPQTGGYTQGDLRRDIREVLEARAQVEARMPEIAELADNHRTTELN